MWRVERKRTPGSPWQLWVQFAEEAEDSAVWWFTEAVRQGFTGGLRIVHEMGADSIVTRQAIGKHRE